MKKFLTANWQNLIMANYEVKPNLLAEFVPRGTSLDFHEEKCFASLVAFNFINTKVLGVSVPLHIDFEEVNLRFYVKSETDEEMRRGVVFVKEIVPRPAIALIARAFYGEPYETWKMGHAYAENEFSYFWSKENCENSMTVEIGDSLGFASDNSHAEFITEHYWGYTKRGANRTDEYKVKHPKWELFEVTFAEIDVDFGFTYGEKFDFLTDTEPASILLAKGSEVVVYKGEKI
jgi:uncharacterized protein YqjF (DUF2071 family)